MTPFQVIGHSPITHYCYLILHYRAWLFCEKKSVRQYRCEHPFIRLCNPSIPLDRRINNIVLSSGLSSLQTRHLHSSSHPYYSQLGSCIYLISLHNSACKLREKRKGRECKFIVLRMTIFSTGSLFRLSSQPRSRLISNLLRYFVFTTLLNFIILFHNTPCKLRKKIQTLLKKKRKRKRAGIEPAYKPFGMVDHQYFFFFIKEPGFYALF